MGVIVKTQSNENKANCRRSILQDLKEPGLQSLLDFTRWMAAAVVFLGHLRNPLLVGYSEISGDNRTLLVTAWYFLSGLGTEAVLVFFVLSGFLVGGMWWARQSEGEVDLGKYCLDRVSRLYIAFFPVLILTCILDSLGARVSPGLGFYDGTHPLLGKNFPGVRFGDNLTAEHFFCNFFMLQSFHCSPLGTNLPLWTLSYEFWFYFVFFLVMVIRAGKGPASRVAGAVMLILCISIVGWKLPVMMVTWLFGMMAATFPIGKFQAIWSSLFFFGIALFVSRVSGVVESENVLLFYAMKYCPAFAFSWLLYSVRGRKLAWIASLRRVNSFLASFSYSLYLVHFPVMLFLLASAWRLGLVDGLEKGFQPADLRVVLIYLSVALIAGCLAWFYAMLTEFRTDRVKRWVWSWTLRRP